MKSIANQIEAASGIPYPPETEKDWIRLLGLAGFSPDVVASVLKKLGYEGYDFAEDLPRWWISFPVRLSADNKPLESGKGTPTEEPYPLTQRILDGLTSRD